MKRMALLMVLAIALAPSQPEEGPTPFPEGLHAVRVSGGVVDLETVDGQPLSDNTAVGPGWYFTAFGYERLQLGRAELEERIRTMRAQMELLQQTVDTLREYVQQAEARVNACGQLAAAACAAVANARAGHSTQTLYLVGVVSLLLGMALMYVFQHVSRTAPPGDGGAAGAPREG